MPKGFAGMTPEKRRAIASMGGKKAHANGNAHEFTPEQGRIWGKVGGKKIGSNREHMREIGRRGGLAVSQDREHMAAIARRGGTAVSQDRAHMAMIGRVGGSNPKTTEAVEPAEPEDDTDEEATWGEGADNEEGNWTGENYDGDGDIGEDLTVFGR